MHIPFVIDNQQHKMADVLNSLLHHYKGQSLDVATAYFNVGGWQLLYDGLNGLGTFRLLLGDEPEAGFDLGLREVGAKPVKGLIRDLAKESFNAKNAAAGRRPGRLLTPGQCTGASLHQGLPACQVLPLL